MKRVQQSVEKMMMRVKIQFVNAPAAVLAEIPGAAPAIAAFDANVELIRINEIIQGQDMTGFTEVKEQERAAVVKAAIDCGKRGRSYGIDNNLPGLVTEVYKPKSWYTHASDLEVASQSRSIYNLLQPLLPDMATYGLTAAKLLNLDTTETAFNTIMNAPRENTNAKKRATENIAALIETNNVLLVQIDAAVDMLEESQPDFWRAYNMSRKLVDAQTHTMALRIFVTDADGVGLGKVEVKVINGATVVTRKTSGKGRNNIQNLLHGTYRMSFEKLGYLDESMDINVIDGERLDVHVKMKEVPVLV